MTNLVFRERILINAMLHLTFSMAPNIVFVPNIHRMQNTDTGRMTQTQLITGFPTSGKGADWMDRVFQHGTPVHVQNEKYSSCRNVHTSSGRGQGPGPIVSYCASPVSSRLYQSQSRSRSRSRSRAVWINQLDLHFHTVWNCTWDRKRDINWLTK